MRQGRCRCRRTLTGIALLAVIPLCLAGAARGQSVTEFPIPTAASFPEGIDGRQRPLGIPTLEDKIVQRTTADVLNSIYETDFLGFSP